VGVSLDQRVMSCLGKRQESLATPVQVGAQLRQAREAMGSSLAEVHDRTGILWRELEALEAGHLSKLLDRQSALVALHRYAAHLGLDESPLAPVIERNWPRAWPTHAPVVMVRASPFNGRSAPMDTEHLNSDSRYRSHLTTFNETMRIPAVGAGQPRYAPPRKVAGTAPLPLRVSVWLVALLVILGGGVLAAKDIKWGTPPAHSLTVSQSKPMVVLASSGAGSVDVGVRAPQFSVLVIPTAPCWVQATVPSSAGPEFVGTLQPGAEKTIDAVGGELIVQIGAGGVTLQVQVSGQTVPGWSFRPSVAPSTLNFSSLADS
jgi:hypothetical protein